jgi:Spy/CpxP family protein refolding chaperone
MKTKTRIKFMVSQAAFVMAAVIALNTGAVALAQPDPDGPPFRRPPPGQERREERQQPGYQPERGLAMLGRVLTEEQRETLREAMQSQRDKMRGIEEKIREAHKELLKASLAEDFNEDVVREKALQVAKLDAELSVLRARALSKVQPPLSGEQIEKILNPPVPRRGMDGPPDGPPPGPRKHRRPPPGAPGDDDPPLPPKPDSP